jgi:hypothetical protein
MDVSGDRFPQAIVEGQFIWTHLLTMLKSLPGDVDYDITPQPVPYLPPRVRLYSLELSSLKDAANRMGLQYETGGCPEVRDDAAIRLEDLEWHDGLIATGDGVLHFSPLLLDDVDARGQRFDDLCRISGGLILATQTETYGAIHSYLCDLDNNRRARLPQGDRQWARWLCYRAAAKRFLSINHGKGRDAGELSMPYIAADGQVVLPYGLMPPPAVARALISCTGLLPTVAWDGALVDAVGTLDQSTLDSFTHPFVVPTGSSLAIFDRVSDKVAQEALGVLGVALTELETGVLDGSSH